MARSESARLLAAHNSGAVIVCACAPYENWEVTYDPRHKRDAYPWALPRTPFRYSGKECKALTLAQLTTKLEGRNA